MVEHTAPQDQALATAGSASGQPPASMSVMPVPPSDYAQLTQITVPLEDAQLAFGTPDASGRLPIILLPTAPTRIRTSLVLLGVVAIVAGAILNINGLVRVGGVGIGLLLIIAGIVPAFFVRIPEGANAILLHRGRFLKTLGPGNQMLMPWIVVSHLVTAREIPFDIPAASVPNAEGVRTSVDFLVTFRVTQPEKFVFAISAPDFDQVCQASGQDSLRRVIRATSTDGILDLADHACAAIAKDMGDALAAYGVSVEKAVLTYIRLPDDVMRSLEARRLATVQLAEETEVQALRVRREADLQLLTQQRVAARRRVYEIEAENERFRLAELEGRLREFPAASRWDFDGQRLDVARAIAGNTKAIVQMRGGADLAASLLMEGVPIDGDSDEPVAATSPTPIASVRPGEPVPVQAPASTR